MIALDTETTGLLWHDKPFGFSWAGSKSAAYYDERDTAPDHIRAMMNNAMEDCSPIVFQNAKFDLRMLKHWGFDVDKCGEIEDIEVLGRLVRNDHLSYSLDSAAKRFGWSKDDQVKKYVEEHKLYTPVKHKYKAKTDKQWHAERVPLEIMAPYATQDARLTYDIRNKLLPMLDPKSVPVWEMEKQVTKVCYRMEQAGIHINVNYTEQALAYEEGLIREAKSQFLLAAGVNYDNKKSTLLEVFRKAGESIKQTEKGNDQLTDDDLERFSSPAAKIVQTIRHHEKRISTYYSSFLYYKDSKNILHADIRQAGTATGRLSYREPNLQNVPKEEDSVAPFVVRGCFMPTPGNILVSLDYKQQEYRLMLAYAKHHHLIREVMGGKDVHQATADLVGIKRTPAKTLNFAILYGAGEEKIAMMLGCTRAEARALKEKYFSGLPEVEQLIFNVIQRGKAVGYVYNWLGRKLHINHRDFAYKLPNHLIQGGGADICKRAMVSCDALLSSLGVDSKLVLQVHDALVFDMPPEEARELVPRIKELMVRAFPEKAGMAMDVDVTWSDKSLAERDMEEWES